MQNLQWIRKSRQRVICTCAIYALGKYFWIPRYNACCDCHLGHIDGFGCQSDVALWLWGIQHRTEAIVQCVQPLVHWSFWWSLCLGQSKRRKVFDNWYLIIRICSMCIIECMCPQKDFLNIINTFAFMTPFAVTSAL